MDKFNWKKCPSVCRNKKYFYVLRWKEKKHTVIQLFSGPWVWECGDVVMSERFKSGKKAREHVEDALNKEN